MVEQDKQKNFEKKITKKASKAPVITIKESETKSKEAKRSKKKESVSSSEIDKDASMAA